MTNSSTDGRYAISYIENKIYDYLLGIHDTDGLQKIQDKRLETKLALPIPSLQKYEGCYTHPAYGTCKFQLNMILL